MSKVVRYCKLTESHMGDNCFDITRPNMFANPYTSVKGMKDKTLIKVRSKRKELLLYEKYFDTMCRDCEPFREEWDKMYEAYKRYGVIYLGCYCKPNEECHGDVIMRKLHQRSIKEMVGNILPKEDDL